MKRLMVIARKNFIINLIVVASLILQFGCSTSSNLALGTAEGVKLNHDRRTAGAIIDDQSIAIKANLAISKDRELWKNSHISTVSYNGSLLLVGQTQTDKFKSKVEELLADIPEIDRIYNQLTVDPTISFSTRMKDTWITTQVKAKLLASRDIGPNRVKVVTENSKVYLLGILTKDEISIVSDLVRKVKGVDEIITVFDKFQEANKSS